MGKKIKKNIRTIEKHSNKRDTFLSNANILNNLKDVSTTTNNEKKVWN